MNELMFENFELSGNNPEKDQRKNSSTKLSEYSSAISFSAKLVDLLKSKLKHHNENNPSNKTSISELKEVYKVGAGVKDDKGKFGLARINMFLRKKAGIKQNTVDAETQSEEVESFKIPEIKSLEFCEEVNDGLNLDSLDATTEDFPDEEDFKQADSEIEAYNLDYDFNSVDDLYLDDYEPVGFHGDW